MLGSGERRAAQVQVLCGRQRFCGRVPETTRHPPCGVGGAGHIDRLGQLAHIEACCRDPRLHVHAAHRAVLRPSEAAEPGTWWEEQLLLVRVLREPLDQGAARVHVKVDDHDRTDRDAAARVVERDGRVLGRGHERALHGLGKLALRTFKEFGGQLGLLLPDAAVHARGLREDGELQHARVAARDRRRPIVDLGGTKRLDQRLVHGARVQTDGAHLCGRESGADGHLVAAKVGKGEPCVPLVAYDALARARTLAEKLGRRWKVGDVELGLALSHVAILLPPLAVLVELRLLGH